LKFKAREALEEEKKTCENSPRNGDVTRKGGQKSPLSISAELKNWTVFPSNKWVNVVFLPVKHKNSKETKY